MMDCFGLVYPELPSYLRRQGDSRNATMPEQAMTVRDVALYLNVDDKTVYRLAKRGELPGFKVAGAWRFKRSDLDSWIDHQKQTAAANNEKSRGKA
jgi:excisionase family DNA binding protein